MLQIAETTGYVLVEPSERVYHLIAHGQIETALTHEADPVYQPLGAKWLTKEQLGSPIGQHCLISGADVGQRRGDCSARPRPL